VTEGGARRERKVVTVVFCDLVGFTARAESLDPEDVEAFLRPYHERVRSELEHYGGTVEKFIGDAVMALFGAPTAHEDDPERAVRAALAIRDFAVEEGLELRVGITTGEALVRLDARPDAGEGMASGDVVNTAARLQSAAPVNGILVNDTTYRATRHAIEYDDAEPVEAKGKAELIPVWHATQARSRLGVDIAHEARSELIGRDRELAVVQDAFDRARHARTPQLLTLVGVPGIGKSRLVFELRRIVDEDPELITWRQGRCLAYGDGVTLWALAEIVKAQAGIAEQDAPEEVAEKLRRAAVEALPEEDAPWVESHLLALAGLAEETELGGSRRKEAFAAWRRFLEGLAEQGPLVLVFEDIHWADEILLDFVDELVDWITDVPLLVVATARPELLERRPGWSGGKLNATTLALAPLTDEQTAQLLATVLGKPVLTAETQQTLLERAGGNPLYAEQFAELYRERGSTDELPLPETLQGIIAARLDELSPDEKALVLDAAVVGKVFWTGALARDESEAAATFHTLERKGFVRRQRRSSVEGQSELAFAHALVRDIAYGQIPRAHRASRHRGVAEWIESLGRPEDHAEMRAYHWRSALDLARASGADTGELIERARLSLRDAGDRAFALNSYAAAAAQYEDALALWPQDDCDRPELLFRRAEALINAGDERGAEAFVTARDALLAASLTERAAEAEALLAQALWYRGENQAAASHYAVAHELIDRTAPSPAVARVLAFSARHRVLMGETGQGLATAESALRMAETLGLDELKVHALTTVGTAQTQLSLEKAERDLRRAVDLARAVNSPLAASALNNLSVVLNLSDGRQARELQRDALEIAVRFGDAGNARFLRGNLVTQSFAVGDWADALPAADEFIAECEAGSPHYQEAGVRESRGFMRVARGDVEQGLDDVRRALRLARELDDPQSLLPGMVRFARVCLLAEQGDEAVAVFSEALDRAGEMRPAFWMLPEVGLELDRRSEVREILASLQPSPIRTAGLAVLDGEFGRAAEIYEKMGYAVFEADARVRAGRDLIESGRLSDGEAQLAKALAFYRSVGAALLGRRVEAQLSASG
jgi:class 3 adenylate cyclase/tetratricopeptide (TPR) repeat protein